MTASPGMWGSKTAASCSPYRPITLKSHGRLAHSLGDSEPSCLSLRQIIGASTTSPAGFDSLPALRSIAYTAGGIAVVVTIDHELSVVQRFFRARPTAAPVAWPMPSQSAGMFASGPELRKRSIPTLPDIRPIKSSLGGSLNDWEDSPTSRTWTARERVKAASCVSFSADGKFLAVGEVIIQSLVGSAVRELTGLVGGRQDIILGSLYFPPLSTASAIRPSPSSRNTATAYLPSPSARTRDT
jgi:hypothetical protein